jgi:hypothetical protein
MQPQGLYLKAWAASSEAPEVYQCVHGRPN